MSTIRPVVSRSHDLITATEAFLAVIDGAGSAFDALRFRAAVNKALACAKAANAEALAKLERAEAGPSLPANDLIPPSMAGN